jgi:uncharacterized protein YjiS (DUF1127 family)
MQRYQIPQPPLLLKAARGPVEGLKNRNTKDTSPRPLYRPVSIINNEGDRPATVQPSSATVPPRGPVGRFFSRMIEQLVIDFASGAAATHPEAYLMWLEFNESSRANAQNDGETANQTLSRYSLYTEAERRTDMHAYLSQPQPISTVKAFRRVTDVVEATPILQDAPAKRRWPSVLMDFIAARVQQMRETRRGLAALYSMDDRMLKDIGISRYEIEQVARHGRARQ